MHDPNLRLRLLMIVFLGIASMGAVLYWRTQYLVSTEYVQFPTGTSITSSRAAVPASNSSIRERKDLKGYEDLYK